MLLSQTGVGVRKGIDERTIDPGSLSAICVSLRRIKLRGRRRACITRLRLEGQSRVAEEPIGALRVERWGHVMGAPLA